MRRVARRPMHRQAMIRTTWFVAVVVVMLLVFVGVGAAAAAPQGSTKAARPTVSLDAQATSVIVGQTVDVVVGIADVNKILSAQYTIQFDPTMLQVEDVDKVTDGVQIGEASIFGARGFTQVNAVDNTAGTIDYTALWVQQSPGDKPVSGSGSLGWIPFRAVAAGTTDITFVGIGDESVIIVEWPGGTPAAITCDWEPLSLSIDAGYSMYLPLVCNGWQGVP